MWIDGTSVRRTGILLNPYDDAIAYRYEPMAAARKPGNARVEEVDILKVAAALTLSSLVGVDEILGLVGHAKTMAPLIERVDEGECVVCSIERSNAPIAGISVRECARLTG